MKVDISLAYPPTQNTLYAPIRCGRSTRKVLSKKGKAYEKQAIFDIKRQCVDKFKGSVQVSIDMHRPDRRVRDIDNILKITFDCLSKSQIIEDDRHIDVLLVNKRFSVDKENPRIDIEIADLTDFKP